MKYETIMESTVRKSIYRPRTCSKCGYSWNAEFQIVSSGSASTTLKKVDRYRLSAIAQANARKDLSTKEKKFKDDYSKQVLCSQCDSFTDNAQSAHINKGYRIKLIDHYRLQLKTLLFVLIITLLLSYVIYWRIHEEENALLFIISVVLLVTGITSFALSTPIILHWHKIKSFFMKMSEEEAKIIVIDIYKKSDDDLFFVFNRYPIRNIIEKVY